jgi:hypothetical protein
MLAALFAWQQTRLADAQVRVAKAQMPPQFYASCLAGDEEYVSRVATGRSDVRLQSAWAHLFVEQRQPDGSTRRVLFEDFFGCPLSPRVICETIQFATPSERAREGTVGFLPPDQRSSPIPRLFHRHSLDGRETFVAEGDHAMDNADRQVYYYLSITYMNALHEPVHDDYIGIYPACKLKLVPDALTFHGNIILSDYHTEKGIDYDAMRQQLEKLLHNTDDTLAAK